MTFALGYLIDKAVNPNLNNIWNDKYFGENFNYSFRNLISEFSKTFYN